MGNKKKYCTPIRKPQCAVNLLSSQPPFSTDFTNQARATTIFPTSPFTLKTLACMRWLVRSKFIVDNSMKTGGHVTQGIPCACGRAQTSLRRFEPSTQQSWAWGFLQTLVVHLARTAVVEGSQKLQSRLGSPRERPLPTRCLRDIYACMFQVTYVCQRM